MQDVFRKIDGQYAAKASIDIALLDCLARSSMCRSTAFGLDPAAAPVNTCSIGIDTPEITRQKMREAEQFPVLKIKVGLKADEPTIEAVRSVINKPLRVDANEGWTDKERRCRKINWLESEGLSSSSSRCPLPCWRRLDRCALMSICRSLPTKLVSTLPLFLTW